jgi:hypothetical protein
MWGGQKDPAIYGFDSNHVTAFSPLAWRRMYLSTFMFDGSYSVEPSGDLTILRFGAAFRDDLDAGEYPYPFWHSPKKWQAYQVASQILFVAKDGRLRGAYRGGSPVAERARGQRDWDGRWTWAGGDEPRVTLFRNLFSSGNPHVNDLERNYRQLEEAMRPYNCTGCHAPNNPAGMNPLELLTYPNQALSARHLIVEQIEKNMMPPETASEPAGIADAGDRERVLGLARAFEATAELALRHEGEVPR